MKHNRRTILVLLLVFLLAVSCLVGCTKTPPVDPDPSTDPATDPGTQTDPTTPDDPSGTTEPTGPVRVTNVREFLDALKPGAEIILAPGTYELTSVIGPIYENATDRRNGVKINDYSSVYYTGNEYALDLFDLKDITIRGETDNRNDVLICSADPVATVLSFRNCENVTLKNFMIGHSVEPGGCDGDVFSLVSCNDFTFVNLDIYGCGVFGVNANSGGVESLLFRDCLFRDCTGGAFWFQELDSVFSFQRCTFEGPLGFQWFMNYPKAGLRFTDCTFTDCDLETWTNSAFIHNRSTFDGELYSTENPVYPEDRFDPRDMTETLIDIEMMQDSIWEAFLYAVEGNYGELPRSERDSSILSLSLRFNSDGTGMMTKDTLLGTQTDPFQWTTVSDRSIKLDIDAEIPYWNEVRLYDADRNGKQEWILQMRGEDVTFWLSRHHSVSVSSISELLDAIRPGAEIMLKAGTYELSKELGKILVKDSSWNDSHSYAQIKKVFDGYELVIRDCDGLTIRGGDDDRATTKLLTDSTYATLIKFENCNDIVLSKFTSGHTTKGDCMGDVIFLEGCNTALLDDVDLFGCGVVGLRANESRDVTVRDSDIHDCEVGPFIFYDCAGTFDFNNCMFTGSRSGGFLEGDLEPELWFRHCVFGERETEAWAFLDVHFEDCTYHVIDEYTEYEDFTFHRKSAVQIPFDADELNDTYWEALFLTDTARSVSNRLPIWSDDDEVWYISAEFHTDGTGLLYWLGEPDPTPFKWGPGPDDTIAITEMPGATATAALYVDPECEYTDMRFLYLSVNDTYVWCICTAR